jgi:triacylglycerol lipase
MLTSLAPARRRLLLAVFAALLLVLVLIIGTLVIGHRGKGASAARAVDQAVAGPVLLLPGYGGSTSSLAGLAARLRSAGKDASVVSLPDNAEGDLGAQAKVVATAAAAAMARTGAPSVDLVGYSAGGVVARLWLKQYGGAAIVRRVVTLGSPQHGTALAVLGSLVQGQCPTACQQLLPTSPLLSSLNTAPELPAGPIFVSVWSSKDQVVLPPDSAQLTGAINLQLQQICPDSVVTHAQLPTDALVTGIVKAELTTGPASTPRQTDCNRLRSAG